MDVTGLLLGCLTVWLNIAAGTGRNFACDVNLCDLDTPELRCQSGSVILIQDVMCRKRGENCDDLAFQEVTRLCSGRQNCQPVDLWYVRGQFCLEDDSKDKEKTSMSLVFVSYVCISGKAIESNCSRRGVAVSSDQRYVSSPGYPALVIGSSVCAWRIHPPPGYDIDVYVREYLHVDKSDKLFVRIREMLKNRVGMKLGRTSDRGVKYTLKGDIEILMFTHGAVGGHRVWIEYRFARDATLDHLRQFTMPNRTDCGSYSENFTTTTETSTTRDNRIQRYHTTTTEESTSEDFSTILPSTDIYDTMVTDVNSSLWTSEPEITDRETEINGTMLEQRYDVVSDLPIILASVVVGLVFTVALICAVTKCKKRKKPNQSRNCLGTDTVSVASDRALLACTPTQRRCHFVVNSATQNITEPSQGTGNNIMLNDDLETKPGTCSSSNKGVSVIDHHSYQQGMDYNPIDFTKYIITNQQNLGDRQYNEHGV